MTVRNEKTRIWSPQNNLSEEPVPWVCAISDAFLLSNEKPSPHVIKLSSLVEHLWATSVMKQMYHIRI